MDESKKRKHAEQQPNQTFGRANKRSKVHDARHIRTQPSDAALKNGELDLQAFVGAREFEISALEASMRNTKAASSTQAFQSVPRSMRRRTASHNPKKVPKRLRAKAREQKSNDKAPTVEARRRRPRTTRARMRAETARKLGILAARRTKMKDRQRDAKEGPDAATGGGDEAVTAVLSRPARPKIRRNALNDPPKPKAKFRKRQVQKTWLPTHLWHAKRARMTDPKLPLWRFAVPLTPTEKCYRPTHRAAGLAGVVAWDMSYMATIGLYGSGEGIKRVLQALGLLQDSMWGKKGLRWRTGSRHWTGLLSKERKEGRRPIGPATVVWNAEQARAQESVAETGVAVSPKPHRQVFIRTHPSCFLELFEELLKLVKMQTPRLHIEDLRYEIGSIELTGPASTESLLGILHPYHAKAGTQESHADLFRSLVGVTNPACLPENAVLAFSVMDPRLRYPPKKVDMCLAGADARLADVLAQWPADGTCKPSEVFSRDARARASFLPSQKALNRRKTDAPGKVLGLTAVDPPIPVLLTTSRSSTDRQAQGSWIVMAPWACILPLWYSLVHYPLSSGRNPRMGGVDELRQVHLEQGLPWFPGDFPGTDAGAAWEREQRARRRQAWERRPKNKRTEWTSLQLGAGRKGEVGDAMACDFEHMFGWPKVQLDQETGEDTDAGAKERACHRMNQITCATFDAAAQSIKAPGATTTTEIPAHALATVHLTFVAGGVANECARIYRLPTKPSPPPPPSGVVIPATAPPGTGIRLPLPPDLRAQWLRKLPGKSGCSKKKRASRPQPPPDISTMLPSERRPHVRRLAASILGSDESSTTAAMSVDGHPPCPDEHDLMGFVTSGAFNLSEGRSTAIGSVAVERALEALRTHGTHDGRLCVVRNVGERVGWLARWRVV